MNDSWVDIIVVVGNDDDDDGDLKVVIYYNSIIGSIRWLGVRAGGLPELLQ